MYQIYQAVRMIPIPCAVAAFWLAGCVTTPENSPNFPVSANQPTKLQPGDIVDVDFLYWPELTTPEQTIRPDGTISLQLVGDVAVGGFTPAEVRSKLLALYEDKLVNPEINVVVHSLESHRIYVGGEVLAPGVHPINGRMSALEAIMQAGGPLKGRARMDRVVIVRQGEDRQYARTVDLKTALESGESEPFMLEPYDVVFVPQTNIDRVDQWVDQYVNKLIPHSLHYNFTHEVSRDNGGSGSNSAVDVLNSVGTIANNL